MNSGPQTGTNPRVLPSSSCPSDQERRRRPPTRKLTNGPFARFGQKEFAAQAGCLKDVKLQGVAQPVAIKVIGDWAYLRNHIDLTMTPKDGQPMKRAGYTLTILNRQADDRWLITRDANLMPPQG